MKKRMRCNKKIKAFSVAEMLVVMLVLAIVILSMTPIVVKRVKKEADNPDHGSFECYWDGDILKQVERNANGEIINATSHDMQYVDRTNQGFCMFAPKRGAMFFMVNAVGGGSPGTGNVTSFSNTDLPAGNADIGPTGANARGVNYMITFNKHRGIILNTKEAGEHTVSFESMDLGKDLESEDNPYHWLINNGLKLRTILTSDGGELNSGAVLRRQKNHYSCCMEDKSSYNHFESKCDVKKYKNLSTPGATIDNLDPTCDTAKAIECHGYAPNFGNNQNYDDYGKLTNKMKTCFNFEFSKGKNPKNGSRIMLKAILKPANKFISEGKDTPKFAYDTTAKVGCSVEQGDEGCWAGAMMANVNDRALDDKGRSIKGFWESTCKNSDYGRITDFNSEYTCSIGSDQKGSGFGYHPHFVTITGDDYDDGGLKGYTGNYSNADVKLNFFPRNNSDPGAPCAKDCASWLHKEDAHYTANNIYRMPQFTWGNFAVGYHERRMGVNFYAKSGNPGEFRTIYISRLRGKVKIIPGAYRPNSDSFEPGNPTRLCYPADNDVSCMSEGSEMLLRAEGGRQPIQNGEGNSIFIIGNLFNLNDPANKRVIAYGSLNGSSVVLDTDDTSGRYEEFGNYFREKSSDFIYPIPDVNTAIPPTVGQGGGGAYTVYRLSSKPNVFQLWSLAFTSQAKHVDSSGDENEAALAEDNYVCTTSGRTLSGANDVGSYRCYGGGGEGGAVVITW